MMLLLLQGVLLLLEQARGQLEKKMSKSHLFSSRKILFLAVCYLLLLLFLLLLLLLLPHEHLLLLCRPVCGLSPLGPP